MTKKVVSFLSCLAACTALPRLLALCLSASFNIVQDIALGVCLAAVISFAVMCCSILLKGARGFAVFSVLFAAALAVFILLFRERLLSELEYTINCVMKVYSAAFELPQRVNFSELKSAQAGFMLGTLCVVLSFLFSLSVFRLKTPAPVLALSLLGLLPCFITIDTLPPMSLLLPAISILIGLYATAFIRRHSFENSGLPFLGVTAIMLVISIIICNIFPQENFTRFQWQDELLTRVSELLGIQGTKDKGPLGSDSIDAVDSINVGETDDRVEEHIPVMKVISSKGGVMYLCGVSYGNYNSGVWSTLTNEQKELVTYNENNSGYTNGRYYDVSIISEISVEGGAQLAYKPYYTYRMSEGLRLHYDEYLANESGLLSYDYTCVEPEDYILNFEGGWEYSGYTLSKYTKLPEETKNALLELAAEDAQLSAAYDDGDRTGIANAVKKYVSSKAYYSLECDEMPEGKDFPVWFLTEADRGYCVHYATAAAAMLRALGVPARYVTGYYFSATENMPVTVTTDNAHAWAEYFDDVKGWTPIECTPPTFSPSMYSYAAEEPETTEYEEYLQPTQAEPQAETLPARETAPPAQTESEMSTAAQPAITAAIIIGGAVLLVILSLLTILLLRRRRQSGGNRERAIRAYRSLLKMSKVFNIVIPEEIEDIALKARFGRDEPTDGEVKKAEDFYAKTKAALKENSTAWKRLIIYFY